MTEKNIVKEIPPEEVKNLNPYEITYIAMKDGSIIMITETSDQKEEEKYEEEEDVIGNFSLNQKKLKLINYNNKSKNENDNTKISINSRKKIDLYENINTDSQNNSEIYENYDQNKFNNKNNNYSKENNHFIINKNNNTPTKTYKITKKKIPFSNNINDINNNDRNRILVKASDINNNINEKNNIIPNKTKQRKILKKPSFPSQVNDSPDDCYIYQTSTNYNNRNPRKGSKRDISAPKIRNKTDVGEFCICRRPEVPNYQIKFIIDNKNKIENEKSVNLKPEKNERLIYSYKSHTPDPTMKRERKRNYNQERVRRTNRTDIIDYCNDIHFNNNNSDKANTEVICPICEMEKNENNIKKKVKNSGRYNNHQYTETRVLSSEKKKKNYK